MLLAIDSSSQHAGLALLDGETVRAEIQWEVGREHTTRLLPALSAMLELVGARPADIRAVAVATGPGTFNGLRAGLAVAKGLCLVERLPIVGVGTLDATAFPHLAPERPTVAVVALGRRRYGLGVYAGRGLTAETVFGPVDAAAAAALLPAGALVCGEVAADDVDTLVGAAAGVVVVPPWSARRRAGVVGILGARRLQRGEADDLAALEPVYLGDPPVKRRAAVAGEGAACT